MTLSRQTSFVPIGDVVAQHVVPRLHRAQRLPLHVSCIGTASHDGCDETDGLDRIVVIGECPSPEEAMMVASRLMIRGDIRVGANGMLHFRPRIMVIQDSEQSLVLAGAIRAGVVLWQQPVASDAEASRIVIEASKLRGAAFAASGRGEDASAREFRYSAGLLEARLVDRLWRETVAELLQLPLAA